MTNETAVCSGIDTYPLERPSPPIQSSPRCPTGTSTPFSTIRNSCFDKALPYGTASHDGSTSVTSNIFDHIEASVAPPRAINLQ